jgi:hypothetical protein
MNRHQRRKATCSWPGCGEKTDQPFTNGWCVYGYADLQDEVPGLPDDGWLCPSHGRAFEVVVTGEQPPTQSNH